MPLSSNKLSEKEQDKLFCMNARKYGLSKLLLKAVAITESSLDERAFRHEPNFWDRYLRNNPEWMDKDKAEVSSSYGLMQLMYVVAWEMGFRGIGEDLYNPVINVELGAKLIRHHLNRMFESGVAKKNWHLRPIDVAISRYNGGPGGNPNKRGVLRNQKYVDKVRRTWDVLIGREKDCGE